MKPLEPRRIVLEIYGGSWCGQCQFLKFVGVPDELERAPRCGLFAMPLQRAANSHGVLRAGKCVAAENRAKAP